MIGTDIERAASLLRQGKLVAFPTETVYGLGADATQGSAVKRIYAAKGRPSTNPLIVHVSDLSVARRYAAEWPEAAERLARRFWPGPLTLVVKKGEAIAPDATAGGETVGLRSPDHPMAMALLRLADRPVAAPSANRSTRVSPTTAQHVQEELGRSVDYILDGGPCAVGIESTVLDLSGGRKMILRPGAVTVEQIEAEIGQTGVFAGSVATTERATSPGQQAIHYAPTTPAYRFREGELTSIVRACGGERSSWGVVAIGPMLTEQEAGILKLEGWGRIVYMPAEAGMYGQRLYAALRDLDRSGLKGIWVQMPPETPAWRAVRDRLMRATREKA